MVDVKLWGYIHMYIMVARVCFGILHGPFGIGYIYKIIYPVVNPSAQAVTLCRSR